MYVLTLLPRRAKWGAAVNRCGAKRSSGSAFRQTFLIFQEKWFSLITRWSPVPNISAHLSIEFIWIRDLMHSIHIHLKCNLVNFDTPNVFRVSTVKWILDLKFDKIIFQIGVYSKHWGCISGVTSWSYKLTPNTNY